MTVDPQQFSDQLQRAFGQIPGTLLMLHTDLPRLGVVLAGASSRKAMVDGFAHCVEQARGDIQLALPTFNYDFCRTGVYRVDSDPCQVGMLNEHLRQMHFRQRTLTPVFNFCFSPGARLPLDPVRNVFGKDSTFAELARRNAVVGFLGAEFSANTFLHHVEECGLIGYRYLKRFTGHIETGTGARRVEILYRVRPMGTRMTYDWPRLERVCREEGILKESRVGLGRLLWYRAAEFLSWGLDALAKDELYLLDSASRYETIELGSRFGRPLRLEDFEQPTRSLPA